MAYYVRRIARAKWTLLDQNSDHKIDNYRADTIANDMRTSGDTLSFWKADSLEAESFAPIIVINSLSGDNIKTIDLLCIPEELLAEFNMEQADGDTIVYEYKGLHYNLVSLTVKRLVDFARDIVLHILSLADAHPEYVKRYTEKQQLELIDRWLLDGKISLESLKPSQQKAVIRFREKKSLLR